MYKLGVVSAVDPSNCTARVKFPASGDVESYWLQVLQDNTFTNKDSCLPDIGECVAVLLDDKQESGCILGAIYTAANRPPSPSADVRRVTFCDGATIEYDRAAHALKVETAGDVNVTAAHVHITGAAEVTGTTHLDGAVTVVGGSQAVALGQKVSDALTTLKNAISSAATVPQDGGAAFKAAIVGALAAWPPSVAATKLTSD